MPRARAGGGIREQLNVSVPRLSTQMHLTEVGPDLFGQYFEPDVQSEWSWRDTLPQAGTPWVHSLPTELLAHLGVPDR